MELSFGRVLSLIRREVILNAKVFCLLAFALCAICAFIMFTSTEEYCNPGSYVNVTDIIYYANLFFGSLIFSASIFTEFRENNKRAMYLKLPASTLEKWLSKWLFAFPIYIVIATLLTFMTYTLFAYYLESLWSDCQFIPLSETIFHFNAGSIKIKVFLIFQSIMFLLGIIYNKHALLKAIVTTVILAFIFTACMNWLHMPNHADDRIFHRLVFIVPFIWILSYFMLKAKQV